MNNELNKHKSSDKIKWVLTLIAFFLVGATLAGILLGYLTPKVRTEEPVKQEQEASVNNGGFDTEFVNTKGVKLFSLTAMTYSQTTNTATKTIYAQVLPSTAENKNVSWSVKWESENTEDVSNYVTVSPNADNQTYADVTCYAPFDGNIIVTVTTEEGGYTADCIVTFVGVPTEITIDTIVANDGTNYTLGLNGSYAFNVAAINPFNQLGDDYKTLEVSLWCTGSVTKGTYSYDYWAETWSWENEETVALNTMLDKFVTVEYSNGVATITTGGKQIDEYYEKYTNIDGGRTRYYSDKVKEITEDCKIGLTVKEPTSGVVKVIYLNLDKTAVASVNVTGNLLF
ncbi:MAG: hypothetical protein II988_04215 [Clostridia bacterium]|nr:hypothetical protein [Clostridia bacterium]MBQ3493606.1 hypothetical protein [Clostridia bacterium]MBQ3597003.1 hypothetical protein [Clostridia bacterium]